MYVYVCMHSSSLALTVSQEPPLTSLTESYSLTLFQNLRDRASEFRDMNSLRSWVVEHKLSSVGTLWASGIGASLAYSRKNWPAKTSLRLIHARMHAQALTLAVLSSAALLHYYETKSRDDDENVRMG